MIFALLFPGIGFGFALGMILGKTKVFEKVFDEDIDPVVYIEENGLKIVEDTGLLTETVKKIVDANPGPLAELLGGKDKVMGFFVGQLMRELKGKANPDSVRKALAEEIERRR